MAYLEEHRNYARHARSLSARRVRQRMIMLALSAAAVAAVAAVAGPPAVRMLAAPSGAPLLASARARNDAAAWVDRWIAAGATVGCDAAMCAVLHAHHVPSARLWLLSTAAADPMNCDVIVATPAIRARFGSRLAAVYAPATLASFGTGSSRVDIRSVDTIGGTGRYRRAVLAGVRGRRLLGRTLLGNKNILARPGAARVLRSGAADPSLLMALPVLARLGPIIILRFGRPPPGADPAMPVLSVDLTAGPAPAGTSPVSAAFARVRTVAALGEVRRVLQAQRTPLGAARFRLLTSPDGLSFIRIDYAAPAPLNVFGGTLDASRPDK